MIAPAARSLAQVQRIRSHTHWAPTNLVDLALEDSAAMRDENDASCHRRVRGEATRVIRPPHGPRDAIHGNRTHQLVGLFRNGES
jgi:hypothetical protein